MKVFRMFLIAFAVLIAAVAMTPPPIHAQDVEETPVTCSLSVSPYSESEPNHFEVSITLTGAEWGHLGWPASGGTDAQNGDKKPVDVSYDVPNRWLQVITFSVNGKVCATAEVHIKAWEPAPGPENPPGNGGATPGSPSLSIPSVPVVAGSKSWHCVYMTVAPDKNIPNRLKITIQVQGELPVYPVKLDFGDKSFTHPLRKGDTLTETHDYDQAVLDSGVTVSADLSQLGDFAPSCLYTTYKTGGIISFASNTGGSFVK